MRETNANMRFERLIAPHLDTAYNLSRWLTRSPHDAEDVFQEACVRAFRFLDDFHGKDSRAWFLAIVRNTCFSWLRRHRAHELTASLDDVAPWLVGEAANPETVLLQQADREAIRSALEELPVEFREVILLHDMEDFSYREIAEIVGIPMGTVMSRLARGRKRLQMRLKSASLRGAADEM